MTYLFMMALLLCLSTSLGDRKLGLPEKMAEVANEAMAATGIPTWLQGHLLRQICGGLGPLAGGAGQHLSSVFDCMGMVAQLRLQGGKVTLNTKFYPTRGYKIWAAAGQNMLTSKVAWDTKMSKIDSTQYADDKTKFPKDYNGNPNLAFWRIGTTAVALEDEMKGFGFVPSSLEMSGEFNFSEPEGQGANYHIFAHSPKPFDDNAGNLWSTAMAFESRGSLRYNFRRLVYKTSVKTGKRVLAANLLASADSGAQNILVDTTTCPLAGGPGEQVYTYNKDLYEGKSPGVVVTKNYILVPISAYAINPCILFSEARKMAVPRWFSYWSWNSEQHNRILLIRKSDGALLREYDAYNYFLSHAVNAYEDDDGTVVLDLLAYQGEDMISRYTTTDYIQNNNWPKETMPLRLRLHTDKTQYTKEDGFVGQTQIAADFPSINAAYGGKKYECLYMLQGPFSDNSRIVKYSLQSQLPTEYNPGVGVYVGEPVFVAKPGATAEDDGVLLVTGFNDTSKNGLLLVLDAKTMKELGRAEAKSLLPFGLHGAFFSDLELGINGARSASADMPLFIFLAFLGFAFLCS